MVAISGPQRGSEFELWIEETFVGRDPSNTIQLEYPSVSRSHCAIRKRGGNWALTDLESRNGTYINGIPVTERVLQHGDEVQIGDCIFLFLAQTDGEPVEPDSPLEPDQNNVTRTIVLRPEDSRYLLSGGLAGELIENAADRNAQMARELKALLSISVSIHALSGVKAIAHRLLEFVHEATPAGCGAVWLPGSETGDSPCSFGWERGRGPREAPAEILEVITTLSDERDAVVSEVPGASGGTIATAPILSYGRLAGVLAAKSSNPATPLDEEHLQMLSAIGAIAGPALEHAAQVELLENENRQLRDHSALEHGMIGESAAMHTVLRMIARVAPTDATVLIRGESGAGKELVARAIHANSPRVGKPFVAINCATLSETLLESELFGHEKGSFTGAIAQKKGKLEVAEGGSLFLDEVGEMAPALQARLLRVLQEREFERVGGTRPIRVNIRLIAATNRDIEEAIESGSFRRDLYYRLNVIPIMLPALRERREDIPLLANFFISRYAAKTGRKVKGISHAARAYLNNYDWPGNVRELENAMERAVVLGASETVIPEDLPETLLEGPPPPGVSATGYHVAMMQAKKQLILACLEKAGGSQLGAAKLLGLHPNYLSRLIRNLNMKEAVKAAGQ